MNASQIQNDDLPTCIARLASVIESDSFSTGDRAALRRMPLNKAPPLAFHRLALRNLPENWERNQSDWMTLVAGIAIMTPNAFRPGQGLGEALGNAGYSEARLERLLAADGETRRTLLLRAARFLASKGIAFNWADAAYLLLTQDQQKQEQTNLRIARGFFFSLDN